LQPDRPRRLVPSGVLSILGIAVAGYLTIVHYREDLLVCGVTSGCKTVQTSPYSEVAGIPIAILGVLMYLSLLGSVGIRLKWSELSDPAGMVAFVIALTGAVYAAHLTYLELFVIHAICQWCVASAILTLALCLIEANGVWRSLDPKPIEVE
jgi:uncharacterized membrane protein